MYSTLRVLQRGHFSCYERCSSRNTFSLASNSAISLFVRSESWCRLICLFPQTTRLHLIVLNMKLSLSFIRLCIESSKICGFELLLSFVETRHVIFILQAFRLNDTCLCITTSTSITSIKELHLWNLQCFLNCLMWSVLGITVPLAHRLLG